MPQESHDLDGLINFFTNRNPDAPARSDFVELTRQLSLPDTKLLKWLEEDKSVHTEAAQLGADLLCGEGLYKDLQAKYKPISSGADYEISAF